MKEVQNLKIGKPFRKGPVHSERFWQENYILFNEKIYLDLIKDLCDFLDNSDHERTTAIILFDLGEFARYFPSGKSILDKYGLKAKIYHLIQTSDSAEIKKEAITCLQKLIFTSIEKSNE